MIAPITIQLLPPAGSAEDNLVDCAEVLIVPNKRKIPTVTAGVSFSFITPEEQEMRQRSKGF